MSADSDPPADTIVVGGEYESTEEEDDEMLSGDDGNDDSESEEASEAEMMEEDSDPEADELEAVASRSPAAPNDAHAQSLAQLPDIDNVQEARQEDVSGQQELRSSDKPTVNNAVPTKSPLASASDDLSSPSLSIPSDSSSDSSSPAPPAPRQPEEHQEEQEQVIPEQSRDQNPSEPQPAAHPGDSHHGSSTAPPTSIPRAPAPSQPASSIELDIQELLNGIKAAPPSSAAALAQGQPIESAPLASERPHPITDARPEMRHAVPGAAPGSDSQYISSFLSAPASAPIPGTQANARHDVRHESQVRAEGLGHTSAISTASTVSQPPNVPHHAQVEKNAVAPATASSSGPATGMREPPTGPRSQKVPRNGANPRNGLQTFDAFLADEKRYLAEARWERFPEGSRIFVGNLVQERVTKKDVFNLFHKYGRMAQISLKQAFGFVQYHNAADAAEAIRHLQGYTVAGRKINLEVSKTQKKVKEPREQSPENNKRGPGAGRKNDNYEGARNGRDGGRNSDGYRPSYDTGHSGRGDHDERGDRRDRGGRGGRYSDEPGRGRHGGRSRSRSPRPFSRSDDHRQRSPHRSSHADSRYGEDDSRRGGGGGRTNHEALDAQILMLEEVHPDFRRDVQKAFSDRGLKTDAMFVDPRFVDQLIQRQIVDGVLAVVKLDAQAQNVGKVTIQVFNRNPGTMQVTFDEYRLIDINVAVGLVAQKKQRAQPQQQPHQAQQNPMAAYNAQAAALGWPPQPYTYPYGQPQAPAAAANLAGALGQLDPAMLQRVLMAMQQQQQQPQPPAPSHSPAPVPTPTPASAPGAASQININAILANLRNSAPGASPTTAAPPQSPYGAFAGYGGLPGAGTAQLPLAAPPGAGVPTNPAAAVAAASSNPQVQSILATLARQQR